MQRNSARDERWWVVERRTGAPARLGRRRLRRRHPSIARARRAGRLASSGASTAWETAGFDVWNEAQGSIAYIQYSL